MYTNKQAMATPFDLPNLDSEQDRVRALGVKNSGVKEFSLETHIWEVLVCHLRLSIYKTVIYNH